MNVNSEYHKLLQSAAIKFHVPIIAHSRAFTDSWRRKNARLLPAGVPGPQAVGGFGGDPPCVSASHSSSQRARGLHGSCSGAPALPRAASRSVSSADLFQPPSYSPYVPSPLHSLFVCPSTPPHIAQYVSARLFLARSSFGPTPPPLTPGGQRRGSKKKRCSKEAPGTAAARRHFRAVLLRGISQWCGPSGGVRGWPLLRGC